MADRGGLAGGLSTGVKIAAVGLLVHQLMKHARGTQPQPAETGQAAQPSTGGSLNDILGNLLGGGAGGAAGGGLLGGLGGWLNGLRNSGLGRQVDSWVSQGGNEPVAPQDMQHAFDPQELDEIASRAGTTREALLAAITEVAPHLVDRMTPGGRVPDTMEESDLRQALTSVVQEKGAPARPGRPV